MRRSGLKVSPKRYGSKDTIAPNQTYNVDFHCMSYDVGAEIPDRRVYEAAEGMTREVATADDLHGWTKLYVSDKYEANVAGALGAGWTRCSSTRRGSIRKSPELRSGAPIGAGKKEAVRVGSTGALVEWLAGSK